MVQLVLWTLPVSPTPTRASLRIPSSPPSFLARPLVWRMRVAGSGSRFVNLTISEGIFSISSPEPSCFDPLTGFWLDCCHCFEGKDQRSREFFSLFGPSLVCFLTPMTGFSESCSGANVSFAPPMPPSQPKAPLLLQKRRK